MALRVGIIGVGGYTGRVHMPGWLDSPHVEVVAGSDINEVGLNAWGQEFGINKLRVDWQDLINDPDIDIIDICVPNMLHAPMAIAALNAGKHVLCEKPLAPTPQDIRDMIAARDASGKQLMTAQHFRFRGISKAMKAEIDRGALGEVYHARAWQLRRGGLPGRPGFVLKELAGGGACIDIGVHILDLSLWMMGNPKPVAVSGVSKTILAKQEGMFSNWGDIPAEMDVEEFAAGFVRFETGATLILEVAWMLHHDTPGEDAQIWLYGTKGGSHFPTGEIYQTNVDTRQYYNTTLGRTKDIREPHAQECVEFAEALATGQPSPVPAEQSLQVLSILDGIYRSQETGAEVRLDL